MPRPTAQPHHSPIIKSRAERNGCAEAEELGLESHAFLVTQSWLERNVRLGLLAAVVRHR